MASRVKEDEKNERIIRGLLKLPENRRCINCNSLVRIFPFSFFMDFYVALVSYSSSFKFDICYVCVTTID